jgi:hypothetical protein
MTTDNTRYQILYPGSPNVENFPGTRKGLTDFRKRQEALRAQGIKFTTWDTRSSALSNLLRF